MRVAIYGRKITKQTLPAFNEVFETLSSFGWEMILEEEMSKSLTQKTTLNFPFDTFSSANDLTSGVDLMISIGGDGTFLKSVNYIRSSGFPILGINTGRLGFLANVSKENIQEALGLVRDKKYIYQERSLLRVHADDGLLENDFFAMNELALHKKDSSSMMTVRVSLDGNFLNTYWSDGLIVSTPTGSTAYNLSCGGPIVTPGCQVHIVTPIAPHNLNVRPMVIPDHMPITLNVEGRGRSYLLSLDGKSISIRQGQEIVIKKADFMIKVIKFENNNFLDTIRNKMLWGIDNRN
ncbi:MAG: NAD kinase [Crocinitomicaceae bacterium]|jgi:NAD+ kinase|tara:strand:+ start:20194 stop:21072 length:879 start_codon:yes stop_codon:yes gene_type:complete